MKKNQMIYYVTKKKLNNYFFINICFHTSILFIWIQYICSIRKIENDMICKFKKQCVRCP